MIVFLRFIGLMNGAIWFGGAVFFSFIATPGFFSADMKTALQLNNNPAVFPYFAGAIAQVELARYFAFHLACAIIAWLHLLAEWVYLGRPSRKISFSLLTTLLSLILLTGVWLGPKLEKLREIRYSQKATALDRQGATHSFRLWHGVSMGVNLILIGGLTLYFWRFGNPSDQPRFISSVKFRD